VNVFKKVWYRVSDILGRPPSDERLCEEMDRRLAPLPEAALLVLRARLLERMISALHPAMPVARKIGALYLRDVFSIYPLPALLRRSEDLEASGTGDDLEHRRAISNIATESNEKLFALVQQKVTFSLGFLRRGTDKTDGRRHLDREKFSANLLYVERAAKDVAEHLVLTGVPSIDQDGVNKDIVALSKRATDLRWDPNAEIDVATLGDLAITPDRALQVVSRLVIPRGPTDKSGQNPSA